MSEAPGLDSLPATEWRVDITAEQVEAFHRDGFLAIERVAAEAEVEWLRSAYDALLAAPRSGLLDGVFNLAEPYGSRADPEFGQLLFPERFVPALFRTQLFANGRRTAARLLHKSESDLESWTHLIYKSAGSDVETPWHQDEAYWDIHLEYRSVACWFALDDADTSNGCLWYLPGSHRADVRPHRHLGGNPSVHVLELLDPPDAEGAVPVPLAAGGMVLHHPRCLHFAGANASAAIRRAWGITYQTAPVRRAVPADRPWWQEGLDAHEAAVGARRGDRR